MKFGRLNENQYKISTLEQELEKLKIELTEKDRITQILASNMEKKIKENRTEKEENKQLKKIMPWIEGATQTTRENPDR